MFVEPILSSLIVAWHRKLDFKRVLDIEFKGWYLFGAAALIQFASTIIVEKSPGKLARFIEDNYMIIHSLSYLLIFIGMIANRKYKSMHYILAGTMLNYMVIALNGGKMPVKEFLSLGPAIRVDLGHSLMTQSTRLYILADIIPIPRPYPLPKIISIGDIFIMAGAFLFIQEIMSVKSKTVKS